MTVRVMPNRHVASRKVPLGLAALLVWLTALLAFLLVPSAVAGVDLTPSATGGDGFLDGGFFDAVGLGDFGPIGIGVITIGVIAAAAALAFLGGTKFVNSENVLENDARRSIFEYIKEHPGVHLRATATALDLSTTNVLWHLRKLEAAKLVSSRKFEGYKVFYPVEGGIASRKRAIGASVLRNDNARQILEYCLGQPSAHQREIARAMDVNHGTIRWHLRKLMEADLVVGVKEGRQTSYYVSEVGIQLLADAGFEQAKAHLAGAEPAPGAASPAHTTPTAHPLVRGAAGPATAQTPAYGPDLDDE